MQTTLSTYRLITRDIDRSLATTAAQQPVATATAYYKTHIGDVKSIDDFMKDTRLYNYAMKAFGLEDMAYAKALHAQGPDRGRRAIRRASPTS